MEQLYIYFHCDEWKSWDSMGLIGVFEESKLRQEIIEDLKNGYIELDEREKSEILEMDIRTMQELLKYGYIEPVELNERS